MKKVEDGANEGEEEEMDEGKVKEIIEDFLEFSRRFPRQYKTEMVASYLAMRDDM